MSITKPLLQPSKTYCFSAGPIIVSTSQTYSNFQVFEPSIYKLLIPWFLYQGLVKTVLLLAKMTSTPAMWLTNNLRLYYQRATSWCTSIFHIDTRADLHRNILLLWACFSLLYGERAVLPFSHELISEQLKTHPRKVYCSYVNRLILQSFFDQVGESFWNRDICKSYHSNYLKIKW